MKKGRKCDCGKEILAPDIAASVVDGYCHTEEYCHLCWPRPLVKHGKARRAVSTQEQIKALEESLKYWRGKLRKEKA